MYRILKQRLICNNINPTYAETYVKDYFASRIESFNEKLQTNFASIMEMYAYLLLHTLIFNINVPNNNSTISSVSVNTNGALYFESDKEEAEFDLLHGQVIPALMDQIERRLEIIHLLA